MYVSDRVFSGPTSILPLRRLIIEQQVHPEFVALSKMYVLHLCASVLLTFLQILRAYYRAESVPFTTKAHHRQMHRNLIDRSHHTDSLSRLSRAAFLLTTSTLRCQPFLASLIGLSLCNRKQVRLAEPRAAPGLRDGEEARVQRARASTIPLRNPYGLQWSTRDEISARTRSRRSSRVHEHARDEAYKMRRRWALGLEVRRRWALGVGSSETENGPGS